MDIGHFNKEQQQVIEVSEGCHLVLAPPGCGKTAVLAERIVWAHQHGVAFSDMACLTFTNRASKGMRERIMQRLGDAEGLEQLFVGNVHRFCSRFLFDNGIVPEHAAVIDTDTSMSIMADFTGEDELRVLGDNKWRQRYSQVLNIQHLMYQCEHNHPSEIMVHRDAMSGKTLKELFCEFGLPVTQESSIALYHGAEHYRESATLLSVEGRALLESLYVARQYECYKRQNDLLDFEDLLLYTYESVSLCPTRKFRWLQIDEVQDLNPLQLAIVDLFTTPDATVVYLGDAQQAIFSFMGAKTNMLAKLYERCGQEHFHNFFQNYRSPQYLLDVFNAFGENQLGIRRELLPTTTNQTPRQDGDLQLIACDTNIDEANRVARMVEDLCRLHPDKTVAVVVAFNSDADDVSSALRTTPHFKISGVDFFSTAPMRLLLAHLSVLHMEHNFIAWSHLMTGLQLFISNSSARQFVRAMMQVALSPVDFIDYEGHSTYVIEFMKAYEQRDIVVFDTETTGLDVFHDDVVQIAAVKTRRGRVVEELNLFIETDRQIPPMLGDVVNPLVEEYARQPHLQPQEAFQRFTEFVEGCTLLGHNANYDHQIMKHDMARRAPSLQHTAWEVPYDSLKLIRLLRPRLTSYKLRDLLDTLGLEGQNSHLANDDILATLHLMIYCYDRGRSIAGHQMEFIGHHRRVIDRFCHLYADLYRHTRELLYQPTTDPVLSRELSYAYDYLHELRRLPDLPKLAYLKKYIENDLLSECSTSSLAEQLHCYMPDIATLKEADLCGSASMSERVFVSTVHKAKGLEFDNVIVYDAVEGKYPSVYATSSEAAAEEARKFYVAISRARLRLVISYSHNNISRWGRSFPRRLTPYMHCLLQFFKAG